MSETETTEPEEPSTTEPAEPSTPTFLETFAIAVKTIVDALGTSATVAFVAAYDTTRGSDRAVTIVPSGYGFKRAGRFLLDSRVVVEVVIVKRTTDFATEADYAREVALQLADQNIIVDGITYFVEDINVEPDPEQLESNVYSVVVTVEYKATATYG